MDIHQILSIYDAMFGSCPPEEIEQFLQNKIEQARQEQDSGALLSLLNERMGLYRDMGKPEPGLNCAAEVLSVLDRMQISGTAAYGTTLLNVANAYRVFGRLEESETLYRKTRQTYDACLPATDFHYAGLYNNWGLLCQTCCNHPRAVRKLRQALNIVRIYPEQQIPLATTLTNLANALLHMGEEQGHSEAISLLEQSISTFEQNGGTDYHYHAAWSVLGHARYLEQRYQESAVCYQRAMEELARHLGKDEAKRQLEQNYQEALRKAGEYESSFS